ncbi:MAG: DUF3820 family protein [Verrucomicrobiales bacterium]|nr:DUF3820 family protein [Verrucomicrobiales bacterium]MCP5559860.1 DUF3820 family protein [Verrucomicrobiaceae bacterium]
MDPSNPQDLAAEMARDMEEISRMKMPYGKFGPQHFPPDGVPIYDLPAEYLGWFANKAGWPKGKLGRLLQIVHQMKADGSDMAFDPLRKRAGGRTQLRPERQRRYDVEEGG